MDIIVLSIIISLLFIVFAFGPILFQEYSIAKKGNANINFNQFIQRYFANEKSLDNMDSSKRKALYEKVSSNIADMEVDGVYFPDEIKKELEKRKKELE